MTVRWCVDGLRLVERPEPVGDLAFDGWDGVSWQTSVCVSRQDCSHPVVIIFGGHDHRGITLVGWHNVDGLVGRLAFLSICRTWMRTWWAAVLSIMLECWFGRLDNVWLESCEGWGRSSCLWRVPWFPSGWDCVGWGSQPCVVWMPWRCGDGVWEQKIGCHGDLFCWRLFCLWTRLWTKAGRTWIIVSCG